MGIRIFGCIGAILASLWAVQSGANEPDQLWQPVQALFEQADVVFIGEYHAVRNHKEVFQALMTPLVESGVVDTVAVEFVQNTDNNLLQEYLNDPLASAGSAAETQYLLKFSNCNRRCGTYASSGTWPVVDPAYRSLLREMRRLSHIAGNHVRFCGVNTDQFLNYQFNDVNSDVAGLNLLPLPIRTLGSKIFGKDLLPAQSQYGWGSGSVRELRFAAGVAECLAPSKKALVFVGGSHAMQYSKIAGAFTVADLVPQISGKRIFSGVIATASTELMQESKSGVFSRVFQSRFPFASFHFEKTKELTAPMVKAAVENGTSLFSLYDFVIFGPNSEGVESEFELPPKIPSAYPEEGGLNNISFLRQDVEYRPQLKDLRVDGKTRIEFTLNEDGKFIFQFAGDIGTISLNGAAVAKSEISLFPSSSPLMSPIYLVNRQLRANVVYRAEVDFKLPSGSFTVFSGADRRLISFETRFDNQLAVGPQNLFPTINLPTTVPATTISILNTEDFQVETSNILCPCSIAGSPAGLRLEYGKIPSQHIYFELRPKMFNDARFDFEFRPGLKIDVRLSHFFYDNEYVRLNTDAARARHAMEKDLASPLRQTIERTVRKMETLIGPYPHGTKLLVSVHPEYDGRSMEYRAAAFTGLGVLVHEIIHQWFATSVMPQTNADSWLMEAITSWLETRKFSELAHALDGFYKNRDALQPSHVQPAPWDGETARKAVFDTRYCPSPQRRELCEGFAFDWDIMGPALLDRVDKILSGRSGGKTDLVAVLKEFHRRYSGKFVTSRDLVSLLNELQPAAEWENLFNFSF